MIKYKGHDIEFSENNDHWEARLDGEVVMAHTSLKELKSKLDKHVKKEFKPIDVYQIIYDQKFKKAKITTVYPNGSHWLSFPNKSRAKEYGNDEYVLCPVSDEDLKKISLVEEISKKIDDLNQQRHKTMQSIKKVSGKKIAEMVFGKVEE